MNLGDVLIYCAPLIAVYSISNLALRENMEEFKNCLSQINDIENIK